MSEFDRMFSEIYNAFEGNEMAVNFAERHGIQSQAVLTVTNDEIAGALAEHLAPRIEGRTVVEIGGGIGLLSCHLGHYAKRVFCIEANPMWSWVYATTLAPNKPKNVSFLFGAADEFADCIKADIAIFCTHSGVESMRSAGALFAPEVVDVYGELIAENPNGFDRTASFLRRFA